MISGKRKDATHASNLTIELIAHQKQSIIARRKVFSSKKRKGGRKRVLASADERSRAAQSTNTKALMSAIPYQRSAPKRCLGNEITSS